jgi:hypothetical protein
MSDLREIRVTGGNKRETACLGIGPKGDRNNNNNNNNNNSAHSPVQNEKQSSNTSPYPACPFFQFSNRLTDSNKTRCQHQATEANPVAVFLTK